MKKYDVKTVGGVDFIYIGNDVNGNCKYAVNYRAFLNEDEMSKRFKHRIILASFRAKAAFFERKLTSHIEPFYVIRTYDFAGTVQNIERAKRDL